MEKSCFLCDKSYILIFSLKYLKRKIKNRIILGDRRERFLGDLSWNT